MEELIYANYKPLFVLFIDLLNVNTFYLIFHKQYDGKTYLGNRRSIKKQSLPFCEMGSGND